MWADRDVRRVVLARFISRVGGEAAFFVGIWGKAAFDLGASAAWVAAVMGALGVASLIGSAVAGVLVDRFGPRKVVMIGEILFVPVAIGMVFADTLPSLVVATFVLGLVGTPVFTAISSFGPFLTDDSDRLARINSLIEGAAWAAFVVGPAVGAIIAGSVGLDWIFVLDAATSAVAAMLIFPVATRQLAREREKNEGLKELREGFTYAYRHRSLRFYIWLGSTVWILFGTFSALEPLFYRDILQVEPETLGWVNSIFGLGLVTGTLLASRLPPRYRSARSLVLIVGLNSVGVLAYVGTDQLRVVVGAGVFWGLLIGVMAPLLRTLIQLNTADELMGRITGVTQIHSEVGHLLPLAIAPALAGVFGVQRTLIYSGVVLAVIALLFLPTANRLDRDRAVEVPRTGLADPSDEPKSVGH
ncbi:MAG TPA: MFS transporter [Acidimicrobiia bacterium]|jgi:MFS family permease